MADRDEAYDAAELCGTKHATFSHIFKCMRNKRINLRLLLHLDPVWFVFLAASFLFGRVPKWSKGTAC